MRTCEIGAAFGHIHVRDKAHLPSSGSATVSVDRYMRSHCRWCGKLVSRYLPDSVLPPNRVIAPAFWEVARTQSDRLKCTGHFGSANC